ncbi:pectate lyase family protein [Marinimicrobium alkaliphilum]|uniref:pectate lyase family protein n=1 Tax=Marinimicrobium alkaliphilum TaxID=2202654 RepID=UPI000DB9D3DC|nr:pectate lyase [Marinimicrobium alkaliphilum]
MFDKAKLALTLTSFALLSACGGSSSDDDNSPGSDSAHEDQQHTEALRVAYCEKINTVYGFATADGGVTGGGDTGQGHYVISVSDGETLRAAVHPTQSPYSDKPLTIYIDGLITVENNGGVRDVRIQRSDLSLIGRGENPGFESVAVEIRALSGSSVENIEIRNLSMRLVPQSHGPGDIISLDGRSGPVRNIWIDHNEFYNSMVAPESANCGDNEDCHKDYYDELVSGRADVSNVTLSYNYLHNSWKTSLWGSSDSDDNHRKVTFHHNFWETANSRTPLFRSGELHVFNNYFKDIFSSGVNVRQHAVARIEGSVFQNAVLPIASLYSERLGHWDVNDNVFINSDAPVNCPGDFPPCEGRHEESLIDYTPDYDYADILMSAEEVTEYVVENAGPGNIDDCMDWQALTD